MHFCKLILISIFISSISYSQKYFEGKITQDVTYSNSSMGNSTIITSYKGNKSRTDINKLTGGNPYTSISIMDFGKREMLMLMDMPDLNTKTATLMDCNLVERPTEKLEKFEDYKTILNHKCQKIVISTVVNGKETITTGYADLNYSVAAMMDFTGKTIDYPLFFEVEIVMPTMAMSMTLLNISEEILPDYLFNINITSDYKVTDIRKNKGQTVFSANNGIINGLKKFSEQTENSDSNPNTETKPQTAVKTEDFNQYTDPELETKLQAALKIEDFDTAVKLKEVIEKRGGQILKYKSKTISELEDMLKTAVSKEDFETATQIQEEIEKRTK